MDVKRLYLIPLLGGFLAACAPTTTTAPQAPVEPPAFVKEFQAYMEGPKKTLREDLELLLKAFREADLEAFWLRKQVDTIWDRTLEKPPLRGLYACLYGVKSDLGALIAVSPLARPNDPLTAESWLQNAEARARLAKGYENYQLGERIRIQSGIIYADLKRGRDTYTFTVHLEENPNWRAVRDSLLYFRGEARRPTGWRYVPEARDLNQFLGPKALDYLRETPSLWDRACPNLKGFSGRLSSGSVVTLEALLFVIAVNTEKRPQ